MPPSNQEEHHLTYVWLGHDRPFLWEMVPVHPAFEKRMVLRQPFGEQVTIGPDYTWIVRSLHITHPQMILAITGGSRSLSLAGLAIYTNVYTLMQPLIVGTNLTFSFGVKMFAKRYGGDDMMPDDLAVTFYGSLIRG